jgi:hypothetical protein
MRRATSSRDLAHPQKNNDTSLIDRRCPLKTARQTIAAFGFKFAAI